MILSILLISGVQLLSIGVLGEYLGRIYLEVKNRPAYVDLGRSIRVDTPRVLGLDAL